MTKKFFINRKMSKMLKMPKAAILNAENFKDGARMIKLTKCSFPNGERKWRTFLMIFSHNCHFRSYSIRDRYTVRPNSSYLEEVYHGHWDQIKRDEDEIEKVMDMKWDEYVDMFGFTPAEYIGSPAYKAKYGENQVFFCNFI